MTELDMFLLACTYEVKIVNSKFLGRTNHEMKEPPRGEQLRKKLRPKSARQLTKTWSIRF